MRVVSLLPSATEVVHALGAGELLVGRSHECDFPPQVATLPAVTAPKWPLDGGSYEIDQRVKALLREGLAVYRVDVAALDALAPDVILTQAQCEVCAVSLRDVEAALCQLVKSRPRIVSTEPNALADVYRDMEKIAGALALPERGRALTARLRQRMQVTAERAREQRSDRPPPSLACIEWTEPLMGAGNWMPELTALAGGRSCFGTAGAHTPWIDFAALAAADPDVILIAPCGFTLPRARHDAERLAATPGWGALKAVRRGRVFVGDGHQYFNRPGPRLCESLDILAAILHHGGDGEPLPPGVERMDSAGART